MSFDSDDTTEEHERRITRCRSCGAMIIFLPTAKGKPMPVDAHSVEPDDDAYDAERHESHFASCPQANRHRKPR